MLTFRDLSQSFRQLDLGQKPVIAHASLSAFGEVQGGAETILGALLRVAPSLLMPAFTYQTMVIPDDGPSDNGMVYGSGQYLNHQAEFFDPNMPVNKSLGIISETLRQHSRARRSLHPIYSFAGIESDEAVFAQSIEDPFAPIEILTEADGWVLLLGVGHTANTSIHYGEQLAGRRQFTRWALSFGRVVACPHWPGCSSGFEEISPHLDWFTHKIQVGSALVQAMPLKSLVAVVQELIAENPHALLCKSLDCERCNAIRKSA